LGYKDARKALKQHIQKRDIMQLKNIKTKFQSEHPNKLYITEAGLYSLMLRSKMPKAIQFSDWVTHEVLPNLRKYGSYKLAKKYQNTLTKLQDEIKCLRTSNLQMETDLKKEKYPNGGMVYILDHSTDKKEIYRLGLTANMRTRKQVHNTHLLHKIPVAHFKETDNPKGLEMCIRSLILRYKYRNNKDFFICSLSTIKKAFAKCHRNLRTMEPSKPRKGAKSKSQKGGKSNMIDQRISALKKQIANTKVRLARAKKKL